MKEIPQFLCMEGLNGGESTYKEEPSEARLTALLSASIAAEILKSGIVPVEKRADWEEITAEFLRRADKE